VRAEGAAPDFDALACERRAERLEDGLRLLGASGVGEARTVSLRRIGNQRELADDEGGSPCVEERPVEPPLLVFEDAQTRDLARQALGCGDVVANRDAEQDAEAGADLPDRLGTDRDAGPAYPLQDRPRG
jgi:hypothetical protein